jgi:hypothetical protein
MRTLFVWIAAGLGVPAFLRAQTSNGSISGRVLDPSEAAVPQAKVAVVNEATRIAASTISNDSGVYAFPTLTPGIYRLEVEAPGFKKLIRRDVGLEVSQRLALDVTLELGNVAQTVEVTGAPPVLETGSAHLGQHVERQAVEDMPLNGRRATDLVAMSPATVFISGGGGEALPIFTTGGSRARNQQFSLDGGNATNAVGLAVPQQSLALPVEAMQEFRLITNNYAAEHGHSGGGVVALSTRAGTNEWHGGAFEYFRNSALDSRNFFSARKAPLKWNVYGAYVGGPIRRDRTHFFALWEGAKQIVGGTQTLTVPTGPQREGDFSATRAASGAVIPIYDPSTTRPGPGGTGMVRDPFPGNRLPPSSLDPVAAAVRAFWPLPNLPGTITGANNFTANPSTVLTRNIIVYRIDHRLTERDLLTYRQFLNLNLTESQATYAERDADPFSTRTEGRTHNYLISETHTFSPNLVNEFRYAFLPRFFLSSSPSLDKNAAERIGLRGVSGRAFPQFVITGMTGVGRSGPFRGSSPIDDRQVQDSLMYVRGRHILKLGGEYRWGAFGDNTDTNPSGQFNFNQLLSGLPGVGASGHSFASFLLGQVNSASIVNEDELFSRAAYQALFVQDDWKAARHLTLNLGLRWETERPRTVDDDKMNAFDPFAINPVSRTPGVITFAGREGVPRSSWNADYKNFGPRFGFSWNPPGLGQTVIRGGYGIFYYSGVSGIVANVAALGFSLEGSSVSTQPGITPAFLLRSGYPPFTPPGAERRNASFGAVPAGASPTTAVTYFHRDRATPYSQQFNLNVQHELARNILVEVGYLGNVGHQLTGNNLSINQVRPELMGAGNAQARRPFPQFSGVSWINPAVGNSTYHAFFWRVQRRFSGGFSLLAHYTFSKFIDDLQSFTELGNVGSYMDAYNRGLDKSLSGNDIRHRAVIAGLYEIPLLRSSRGWAARVLGGWNLSYLLTFQSGPPSTALTADTTNAFPAGALRPDLVGDPKSGARSLQRWFNTDAFRAPAPFRFGTAGRSVIQGPGIQNIDFSVLKDFRVTERATFRFRADFFNLFNHANFGLPGATLNTPAFGVISSARDPRLIQFGAKMTF